MIEASISDEIHSCCCCALNVREFLPCEGGGKERQVEGANSETGGRGTERVGTCPERVGTYQKSPFKDKRPKWRKGLMMAERCHSDGSRSQSVPERVRTCLFYLILLFFTEGLHRTCQNVSFLFDFFVFHGRVARNVSERVFFICFFVFHGRVARNV